jgi:hypothetical protein
VLFVSVLSFVEDAVAAPQPTSIMLSIKATATATVIFFFKYCFIIIASG